MIRTDRRIKLLAACLSALAGYVDAIGFLTLGGFFVSFMSGNSTRAAVGLAEGSHDAVIAAGLIALFVAGVVVGSLVGHFAKSKRRPAVLAFVTLLLIAAAALGGTAFQSTAIACMVLAMGAENAIFERDGEVHIGLTYMTGTLVKLGQRLTAAFLGGDRWAWLPYLLLWLGLMCGAVTGALTYPHLGLNGLWFAAGAAAVFTAIATRLEPDASAPTSRS